MKSTPSVAALAAAMAWGVPALTSAGAAWAQGATEGQAAPAEEATTGEAAAGDPDVVQDMAQGAETAPVTMIEDGSFTCPHCAAFHAEQYQQLKTDYVDTGKVRFVFREVYFDRFGLWASMIARCSGEMRFFGVHDILYDTQREWIGEGDPAAIADNLRRIGKTAGMDDATLDACLKDEAQAEALLAWYQENAERDGIQSTPTFIINGETHSNMAYEELQQILEAELTETAQ